MVFDLGKAMRTKEEFESARLIDFDFRRRARATRMTARALGIDESDAAAVAAVHDEAAIAGRLAEMAGRSRSEVAASFATALRQAHDELIVERGDPTPHRMG